MNGRTVAKTIAMALLWAGTVACSSTPRRAEGPTKVDDLVGWVERVYVEAELAKGSMHDAVDSLQGLVRAKFADPVVAYGDFVAAIERSEAQAAKLRASVDPMKSAAGPVFEQWQADLEGYTNPAMRKRSEARLQAAHQRYEAVVAAVDPAQATIDILNKGLRDHALFLKHDLNTAALAGIRDEADQLTGLSAELETGLDACLRAARSYVDAAALPLRSDGAQARARPVAVSDPAPLVPAGR